MSTWGVTFVVLGAWMAVAVGVGLLLGRITHQRDSRRLTPESPLAGTVGPATATAARRTPVSTTPTTAQQRGQAALRIQLERLLAEMDHAELDGTPDEITDLCRIWSARASSAIAEDELNRAIEQARRNGRSWETIRIVLELPHPS